MTAATPSPSIETDTIHWRDGHPVSSRFDAPYFVPDNGLEAIRSTYINLNDLPARFSALARGEAFVVAESGFGTGLNFLATWQTWRANALPEAQLHFVSVEPYPLTKQDLQQALECWPELAQYADQLKAHYPPAVRGAHRLLFDGGRVRLTLYFGDSVEGWNQLRFVADAWFMAGFSAGKTPGLLTNKGAKALSEHSHARTTLATSAPNEGVKLTLERAGFRICETPCCESTRDEFLFIADPALITRQPTEYPVGSEATSVTVIGAGIAGASTARNLADRGYRVTVLAKGAQPADGASGNPQGALYVKLGVDFGPETELALRGLLHSQRAYRALSITSNPADEEAFWFPTGLLQMATTPRERDRQARFLERSQYPAGIFRPVGAEEATTLAGIPVNHEGLYFPDSGWLIPANLCRALLNHPNITTCFNTEVTGIVPETSGWCIQTRGNTDSYAPKLVVAGGHEIASLLPGAGRYRFKPIRGQVTSIPADRLRAPQRVVCGHGYVNPVTGGQSLIGATFDLKNPSPTPSTESNEENLSTLASWLPDLIDASAIDTETLQGRVSFRCTTHDYQPAVGAVDTESAGTDQSSASLFVLTGLGSKGLSFAPLLAEWLGDVITGQPECLEQRLSSRLTLARCRIQD
ncbi:MAG: FAD-dependent cmnm(5)s(2)U34 oxidoreductase [Alteromonadaceae bacterium]|nr:FAD-dependent cmnm(5)s(2)U34 oxidoreductase [Alteromonadaceae bacterium]MBH85742.1 FAD-dependent cmnm(5)s(2)U34 oxidoreductase [Alteromonadaceae bacterium]|tara:strand:+ start:11489 stop:13408 length:1920 start_codon:yes stop_codon:yes gene_type:complete